MSNKYIVRCNEFYKCKLVQFLYGYVFRGDYMTDDEFIDDSVSLLINENVFTRSELIREVLMETDLLIQIKQVGGD